MNDIMKKQTIFDLCAYKGCCNTKFTNGGTHLFRFPAHNDSRFLTWIKNTANPRLPTWSVSSIRRAGLCGKHFKPQDFVNESQTRLKRNVVPLPYNEQQKLDTVETVTSQDHECYMNIDQSHEQNMKLAQDNVTIEEPTEDCDDQLAMPEEFTDHQPTCLKPVQTYKSKLIFNENDEEISEWLSTESLAETETSSRNGSQKSKELSCRRYIMTSGRSYEHKANIILRKENAKLRKIIRRLQLKLYRAHK